MHNATVIQMVYTLSYISISGDGTITAIVVMCVRIITTGTCPLNIGQYAGEESSEFTIAHADGTDMSITIILAQVAPEFTLRIDGFIGDQ